MQRGCGWTFRTSISCLFNDALSNSDCRLYYRVTGREWIMNLKGCGRKPPWPKWRYYQGFWLEDLRGTIRILNWSSNREPPGYKSESFPRQLICSVTFIMVRNVIFYYTNIPLKLMFVYSGNWSRLITYQVPHWVILMLVLFKKKMLTEFLLFVISIFQYAKHSYAHFLVCLHIHFATFSSQVMLISIKFCLLLYFLQSRHNM
jgi:hypothetical protein